VPLITRLSGLAWPVRSTDDHRQQPGQVHPRSARPAYAGHRDDQRRTAGFRAELPDGRIVWLVIGYEFVRQMIIDQRFSRALAVAPLDA
jgi:hypothetical protein